MDDVAPAERDPLSAFQPATRRWFAATFPRATRAQIAGWPPITAGKHTLILAPTGSGKTLAAFLACLDRLTVPGPAPSAGVRVLYVSPLKALAADVQRNLRVPLAGIEKAALQLGTPFHLPSIALRTGDTPARERRQLLRAPPQILITTPESLYLLLGSGARDRLRTVETVIIDEIHALAPTKRGAHLALSLERLAVLTGRDPQRIGLSATQRPLEEVGRFLGGDRPVSLVDTSEPPRLDLQIEVPVDDLGAIRADAQDDGTAAGQGVWGAIVPRLLELVRAHQSTIIFTNSRRLCERLAQNLNDLAAAQAGGDGNGAPLVRAHHGSVARAHREEIEELLKTGRLRGLVATSSLELGIDMGAVDLVVQVASPGSVARGLQRIGRAGHSVGARSAGRIFPKHRGDLLEATAVARRMAEGEVEPIAIPRNPLDVVAQQIVAMVSVEPWTVDRLEQVLRRAYGFAELSRELLEAVLDMLTGRYPSDELADLRPRLTWDRTTNTLTPRRDAKIVALVNGGTIPDRGLYAVHLGEDGPRIGELDEEMVHETRAGEVFLLGASSWRVQQITRDRVVVAPAPGEPGKMPFWRGEGPGRPIELGRATGALARQLAELSEAAAIAWLQRDYPLTTQAAQNLWRYIHAQKEATGTVPSDREITIERFRDELGDWRVCILSPFGARVHAPWALALEARLTAATGVQLQTLWSDDGIVLRFANSDDPPPRDLLLPDPEEVSDLVVGQLGGSALFASHFRENAARALLLPRRAPNMRTPLWSQRLKAQALMAAATRYPSFPIVLETYRECLKDVFDVPALTELLAAIRRRDVRVVEVETAAASPFARSLAFAYVATYMYEGDAPLAERRAQALTLDRGLLRELLGEEALADLLDPAVRKEVENELQALAPDRQAHHADALTDLLRRVGDLSTAEISARTREPPQAWLEPLAHAHRIGQVDIGGSARWIAIEDVARYREALQVTPPAGTPAAFLAPAGSTAHALGSLVARFARTHGPFGTAAVSQRWGIPLALAGDILAGLAAEGRVVEGEFGAGGAGTQWCDAEVLRTLRRRTLAALRHQVAPVAAPALARFLPSWHGIGSARSGLPRLREVVAQLEGLFLPFSDLEHLILPARIRDYSGNLLDELGSQGELVWVARGGLGDRDGRIALFHRDRVRLLVETPTLPDDAPALQKQLLETLETQGASFFAQLQNVAPASTSDEILAALWALVWAGLATNDTFAPLRALIAPGRSRARRPGRGLVAQAAGRWSAVAALARAPATETERAHARATTLLERYGVISREAATVEGMSGGFAAVSPVLRAMEEAGKIRRGYFVEGLSGAQYAHAGAVDRLRAARDEDDAGTDALALASLDPANPYGALLPWPSGERAEPADVGSAGAGDSDPTAHPRRAAGTRVVLVHGKPALFVERGGKRLRVFAEDPASFPELLDAAVAALRATHPRRRGSALRVEQINGVPALRSTLLSELRRAGFRMEPGGLVLDPDSIRTQR